MDSSMSSTCSTTQLRCYDDSYRLFCIEAADFDCSWYDRGCACPALRANPDIAGKGVIAAFIITASLTLIGTVAYLLFRPASEFPTLNPINRKLRLVVSRIRQRVIGPRMTTIWSEALFEIVMQLSDQQLVTGTAMLATIIYLRNQGAITVYHFTMATNLAWFSSNTHLLSLLILRGWLSEEGKVAKRDKDFSATRQSRSKSIFNEYRSLWRAIFMVIMAILLIYTNLFVAYEDWYDKYDCPVSCVPSKPIGGQPKRWLIVNLVFILSSYPIALIGLFAFTRREWMKARSRIHNWDEKKDVTIKGFVIYKPYRYVRRVLLSLWYFAASEIFEVAIQIAWFGLGIRWVVEDRKRGHDIMTLDETDVEDSLGFGQLVPILLLALPLMSFLEACYYSWRGLDVEDEQKRLFKRRLTASHPLENSHRLWHDFNNNPQGYSPDFSDSCFDLQPAQIVSAP
ncbi:hypothetical protein BKA65DRAFT_214413 [Rhexocercosporidium sp. MPI-PUGE-AT-0058]|nr:hypothetical protein BKA65DRAFT_214413 [Rhexocercosporidium sp. MPI-PUGE-AT-0058]